MRENCGGIVRIRLIVRSLALLPVVFLSLGCTSTALMKGNKTVNKGYQAHVDMRGDDILSRCRHHLKNAVELKNQLVSAKTHASFMVTLGIYNDLLVLVDAAMSQASLLSQVHPHEQIRKDAEVCEQEVSSFVTELSLDRSVFEALNQGERAHLDEPAQRMIEHTLRDFRRAGVDKDDATRDRIKALKAELVTIGQEFGQNIRADRYVIELDSVADLAGLPQDYIDSHKPNAQGKIEISTDYPDYIPFMQYANSDELRKKLRFKYLNRGHKNGPVLKAMIEKRHELASLLGYTSYADYVVEDKMIKNSQAVQQFIEKISSMAKKGADKEYQALLNYKKQYDKRATSIYGHESSFLEQAFKKSYFEFDAQSVRPYFPYEQVKEGLLSVTGKLYGIRYEPVHDALVWDKTVAAYDVFDKDGKLGRIYLDMHPRDGKFKHAAQFTIVSGLLGRQYPEGALVCNFPSPKDGPALMEHDQVVTMFHEFGHLLHHIFAGKQQWVSFSGTATEWDFVEAPSQFQEEWAWAPDVLTLFAKHYQTNEPISAELVKKMRAADEFGKALSARQQMFYAALSADYFGRDPGINPLERLKLLQAKYSYFPYEEGTRFDYSFGHLDGYSAMYYTYMWSLSLAKDLFEPFKMAGMWNVEQAGRFRDLILKPGGSKDAADLVKDYLGRPFKFDAFERWLTSDGLVAAKP